MKVIVFFFLLFYYLLYYIVNPLFFEILFKCASFGFDVISTIVVFALCLAWAADVLLASTAVGDTIVANSVTTVFAAICLVDEIVAPLANVLSVL